jgi:predicted O-linked N-acetylglucosamine transferase (SPINDLY family)
VNWLDIGLQHHRAGRAAEAEAVYRQALAREPNSPDALYLLGVIEHERGNNESAAELIGRAATLRPATPQFHSDLGVVLLKLRRTDEAVEAFRRAVALQPDSPAAYLNFGVVLHELDRFDDAIDAYQNAIRLQPRFANAHFNVGAALQQLGKLDDAATAYRMAIEIAPDHAEARTNLASVRKDQGQLDAAIELYRQVVALRPNDPSAHSNLAYAIHFHPDYDAQAIYDEARRWNERHGEPLKREIRPHAVRASRAKLRIGYVSPDFREHAVGRFIPPLLEHQDRSAFEVVCYSHVRRADHLTERTRKCADLWREINRMSDADATELIRGDAIDILIDLTMHMERNRLPVFARKPARVQATYLAYCSTTGLDAIDFRITDPHLDPPDATDSHYSERSIWLPQTYWCYQPAIAANATHELPARQLGYITFGCLNNFCKVTPAVLSVWATLMLKVPHSRLSLHCREGSHRQRVLEQFNLSGVDSDRITFVPPVALSDYFKLYNAIDIALDPFPCNGGTTTCDALWMGVPIVSLAGRTAVSRAGLSILSNLGLGELVARSQEPYVTIASDLANDLDRLAKLRSTLRGRMESSPLMDAPRFARNFEAALLQMTEMT